MINNIKREIRSYIELAGTNVHQLELEGKHGRGYYQRALDRGTITYKRAKELAEQAGFEIKWVRKNAY